ncbi:MAG: hypothetical protein K2W96_14280, partial [Gemmataceae bacterium]|nr:hypothetical protein [Gemmataceae bacterium]
RGQPLAERVEHLDRIGARQPFRFGHGRTLGEDAPEAAATLSGLSGCRQSAPSTGSQHRGQPAQQMEEGGARHEGIPVSR